MPPIILSATRAQGACTARRKESVQAAITKPAVETVRSESGVRLFGRNAMLKSTMADASSDAHKLRIADLVSPTLKMPFANHVQYTQASNAPSPR